MIVLLDIVLIYRQEFVIIFNRMSSAIYHTFYLFIKWCNRLLNIAYDSGENIKQNSTFVFSNQDIGDLKHIGDNARAWDDKECRRCCACISLRKLFSARMKSAIIPLKVFKRHSLKPFSSRKRRRWHNASILSRFLMEYFLLIILPSCCT